MLVRFSLGFWQVKIEGVSLPVSQVGIWHWQPFKHILPTRYGVYIYMYITVHYITLHSIIFYYILLYYIKIILYYIIITYYIKIVRNWVSMTWSINYVLAMRRDGPRVAYIFSILDVSHWKIPSLRMSQLPSPKAGSFPVEMFLARSLESYLAPRRHTCVASVAPRHHFYIFLNASRAGVLRFHLNDTALESAGFPLSQGPVPHPYSPRCTEAWTCEM